MLEGIDTPGMQLADEYLVGKRTLEIAPAVAPVEDECPSCVRGRIVNSRCNRCGVVIPSSGTLKNYAWRNEHDEESH